MNYRSALRCLLLICVLLAWLPPARAAAAGRAQTPPGEPTPVPTPTPPVALDANAILEQMTVADKIGQLFLVTFQGSDVSAESDIATLVRDFRVGGVLLSAANGNFRIAEEPAEAPLAGFAVAGAADVPAQIASLANGLQALAMSPPRPIRPALPITTSVPLTVTQPITPTETLTVTLTVTPTLTATPTSTPSPQPSPTAVATEPVEAARPAAAVPLFLALDWTGDDSFLFSGPGGFTPLPSPMAIGATWSPQLAEQVGAVMGRELAAVGINLVLGPSLDVLDVPRPGSKGDLNTRTFGGDPFWVGQMGQAFIRGVQAGSAGAVLTAAKHFPGQGGSDRRPEDEVATVQKSVQQLRQIELAPFAAVTAGGDLSAPGISAALMTSHIRYRGFQGNIRQLTPPISLAPQLQDLMMLKEFADWRAAGGLLISDALGVPALRRYYDPSLAKFPHRQVALDAFLAGNDLLYLGRFALTDNWPDQLTAIRETIQFFRDKYDTDSEFRARVDLSVERIVRQKLRAYGGSWQASDLVRDPALARAQVGQGTPVTQAVARAALTLIYPGRDEFADRVPTAPLADEQILVFTDARSVRECPDCSALPLIGPTAIEEIILRLYGPSGTGQITRESIRSFTFDDLARLLRAAEGGNAAIEDAIAEARWIVFAQLDYNPEEYPASEALRSFLARRSDSLRDKRLVVLAFNAPYYLDTTEISKLTAYFGVYGRSTPFLEVAVRALFREFTPVGSLPVTVTGINYELIRQLEPAPGQIIGLSPVGSEEVISGSIRVGSQVQLETGVILDRKGHPVPDGTPVEFHLRYPAESLALAPKVETTVAGRARTTVALDRPGELWITVQAGEAKDSTRIELRVGDELPGSIATVVPSPTAQPTATPTPTPTSTPTPTATLAPSPTAPPVEESLPLPPPPKPRVALAAFLYALAGALAAGSLAFILRRRRFAGQIGPRRLAVQAAAAALWAAVAAWSAYLLYAIGWLPGATELQARGYAWAAGLVALAAGALTLLWTARRGAN